MSGPEEVQATPQADVKVVEEKKRDEKSDKKDDRDRDRDRPRSSRRSRSRSRDRKSSRRSRSRSRDRRERERRDRDRERDRDRDRDRERRRSRSRSRDRRRDSGYEPRSARGDVSAPSAAPPALLSSMSHRGGGQLDYFSQVRGPVVDQWAALRRTTETRLEAKLSALRAKALQAKDPKNRTQRKVYIGNVLPTLTTDFLRQLFTKTLLISFPQWNVPGVDIIVDIQHKEGAKYAFIEFRTLEMAHAAIAINGTQIMGTSLLVTFPTGYIDPLEAERNVEAAERELRDFRSGKDESPMFEAAKALGLMPSAAPAAAPSPAPAPGPVLSSAFISIEGVLVPEIIDNEQEVTEILEELRVKFGESGPVRKVIVPRPPFGVKASEIFGKGNFGKVFVEFGDEESAQKCKAATSQIRFEGRELVVSFISEAHFNSVLGI